MTLYNFKELKEMNKLSQYSGFNCVLVYQIQVHVNTQCGTEANAPPGAHTVTPVEPSVVGPLELQVNNIGLPRLIILCSALSISVLT